MIKYCRQCGRELHYKEKFYFSDHICCRCRGLASFDDDGTESVGRERTPVERTLFERYPVWQLMIEKAERQWKATHPQPLADVITVTRCTKVSDERITEMLAQYDNFRPVQIEERELIALLQEVREARRSASTQDKKQPKTGFTKQADDSNPGA
ncbi:hypothetical protein [Escherichia albertii]|uniref:hypothetical protein n=1 Tax=Escherichia albertii TaxID=208962 RepID=UPI000BF32367|nr:hypothetical protein [Escherichia albertii]PFF94817.1 hypothetical protein CRH02_16485 [Escherichia albertii]